MTNYHYSRFLDENDFPPIPDALLHALDSAFPNHCPFIEDSERLIWYKAGQRAVVSYLTHERKRQKEADKNTGLDGLYLDP